MITTSLASSKRLNAVKRIGTGLAFIPFPLLFMFAFAVHPGLLNPHMLQEKCDLVGDWLIFGPTSNQTGPD